MNRISNKIILLSLIIQIQALSSNAQQEYDPGLLSSPMYREKLQVFTDRNLYASGEPVLFSVYNMSHSLLKSNNWSTVIYLELINNRNLPVARGKYQLKEEGASGQILIPDSVTSGSYYLRAYTRWMRNFSPSSYYHVPLTVINPHKISMTDLATGVANTEIAGDLTGPGNGIVCLTDRARYGKREKVTVYVQAISPPHPDGYCVSVIKKGYLDTDYSYKTEAEGNNRLLLQDVMYYPETRGMSVSGQVVRSQDRQAVAYSNIYVTLLGADPDCLGFQTDESGRIHFSMPYHTGSRDILITFDPKEEEEIEIIMDGEYSDDYSDIPVPSASFSGGLRNLIEEVMMNKQLLVAFNSTLGDSMPSDDSGPGYAFYGFPDLRYKTEDYIALPNLEEFFFELIPTVYMHRVKEERYFIIQGEYGDISNYPPLILLDYVPVFDVRNILPVSPQQIEYIDIINRIYIRGSNSYGGIISIVSKDGDRAGVKLPSGSSFFSYSTFSSGIEPVFTDYSPQENAERIPDLRTTLYWAPHMNISPGGQDKLEFYTSDIAGEYMIVIRGHTAEGKIVQKICEFFVE